MLAPYAILIVSIKGVQKRFVSLFFSLVTRNQLFCALTNRYVNQKPHEVKGHVEGWRYKQAMEKCMLIRNMSNLNRNDENDVS